MCARQAAYQYHDCRNVAEIQRKVLGEKIRKPASQRLSKDDERMIATWRQNIDRILHIFNVRPVDAPRQSLMAPILDGVDNEQPYDPFGHSSRCVGDPGGH